MIFVLCCTFLGMFAISMGFQPLGNSVKAAFAVRSINYFPIEVNGLFPKWSRTFIEFSDFSKFMESDKHLEHELG